MTSVRIHNARVCRCPAWTGSLEAGVFIGPVQDQENSGDRNGEQKTIRGAGLAKDNRQFSFFLLEKKEEERRRYHLKLINFTSFDNDNTNTSASANTSSNQQSTLVDGVMHSMLDTVFHLFHLLFYLLLHLLHNLALNYFPLHNRATHY